MTMLAKSTLRKNKLSSLASDDFSCLDIPLDESLAWEEQSIASICNPDSFKPNTENEEVDEDEVVSKAAMLFDNLEYSDISRLLEEPVSVPEALSKIIGFCELSSEVKISDSVQTQLPDQVLPTDQACDELAEEIKVEIPREYEFIALDSGQEACNIEALIESIYRSGSPGSTNLSRIDDQSYIEDELLTANLGPLLAVADFTACDAIDLYAELVKSECEKCSDDSNEYLKALAFIEKIADDDDSKSTQSLFSEEIDMSDVEILVKSMLKEVIDSVVISKEESAIENVGCDVDAMPTGGFVKVSESLIVANENPGASLDDKKSAGNEHVSEKSSNELNLKRRASNKISASARSKSTLNNEDAKSIPAALRNKLLTQNYEAVRMNALRFQVLKTPILVKKDNPGDDTDTTDDSDSDLCYSNGEEDLIDDLLVELGMLRGSIKLLQSLEKNQINAEIACEALCEVQESGLTVKMLVKYPFLAGTIDACCRLNDDNNCGEAEVTKLRAAAKGMRSTMMPLFPRLSNKETFIQAFCREVSRHHHAAVIDRTLISKLDRVCQEALKEFYCADNRLLYSAWDGFFIEFCDPIRELIHLDDDDNNDVRNENVDETKEDVKLITPASTVKQNDAVTRHRKQGFVRDIPVDNVDKYRGAKSRSRHMCAIVKVESEEQVMGLKDINAILKSDVMLNAGKKETGEKIHLGETSIRSSRLSRHCKHVSIPELSRKRETCSRNQVKPEIDSMGLDFGSKATCTKTSGRKRTSSLESSNWTETKKRCLVTKTVTPILASEEFKPDILVKNHLESTFLNGRSARKSNMSSEDSKCTKRTSARKTHKTVESVSVLSVDEVSKIIPCSDLSKTSKHQYAKKRTNPFWGSKRSKKNKIFLTADPSQFVLVKTEIDVGLDIPDQSTVIKREVEWDSSSENMGYLTLAKRCTRFTESLNTAKIKSEPFQMIHVKQEIDVEVASESDLRKRSTRKIDKPLESSNLSKKSVPSMVVAEPFQVIQVKSELDSAMSENINGSVKIRHSASKKGKSLRRSNPSKKNEPICTNDSVTAGNTFYHDNKNKPTVNRRSTRHTQSSQNVNPFENKRFAVAEPFQSLQVKKEDHLDVPCESTVRKSRMARKNVKSGVSSNRSKNNGPSFCESSQSIEVKTEIELDIPSEKVNVAITKRQSGRQKINSPQSVDPSTSKPIVVTKSCHPVQVKRKLDSSVSSENTAVSHIKGLSEIKRTSRNSTPAMKKEPSIVAKPFVSNQVKTRGHPNVPTHSTELTSEKKSNFSSHANVVKKTMGLSITRGNRDDSTRRCSRRESNLSSNSLIDPCKSCVVPTFSSAVNVKSEAGLDGTSESIILRKSHRSTRAESSRSSRGTPLVVAEDFHPTQVKQELNLDVTRVSTAGRKLSTRNNIKCLTRSKRYMNEN